MASSFRLYFLLRDMAFSLTRYSNGNGNGQGNGNGEGYHSAIDHFILYVLIH